MEEKNYQVATKAIILFRNKVLLLKTDPSYSGGLSYWDFPGGRIKGNTGTTEEIIRLNIQREVTEEIGAATINTGPMVWAAILPNDITPYGEDSSVRVGLVVFYYLCTVLEEPNIVLSKEHREYKWYSLNELPADLQPFHKVATQRAFEQTKIIL